MASRYSSRLRARTFFSLTFSIFQSISTKFPFRKLSLSSCLTYASVHASFSTMKIFSSTLPSRTRFISISIFAPYSNTSIFSHFYFLKKARVSSFFLPFSLSFFLSQIRSPPTYSCCLIHKYGYSFSANAIFLIFTLSMLPLHPMSLSFRYCFRRTIL